VIVVIVVIVVFVFIFIIATLVRAPPGAPSRPKSCLHRPDRQMPRIDPTR